MINKVLETLQQFYVEKVCIFWIFWREEGAH